MFGNCLTLFDPVRCYYRSEIFQANFLRVWPKLSGSWNQSSHPSIYNHLSTFDFASVKMRDKHFVFSA